MKWEPHLAACAMGCHPADLAERVKRYDQSTKVSSMNLNVNCKICTLLLQI